MDYHCISIDRSTSCCGSFHITRARELHRRYIITRLRQLSIFVTRYWTSFSFAIFPSFIAIDIGTHHAYVIWTLHTPLQPKTPLLQHTIIKHNSLFAGHGIGIAKEFVLNTIQLIFFPCLLPSTLKYILDPVIVIFHSCNIFMLQNTEQHHVS